MGIEIERKFLVRDDGWRTAVRRERFIRQAYLCFGPPVAVRVRVSAGRAVLNLKSATLALTRQEFEYAVPLEEGETILEGMAQGAVIEKTRYDVVDGGQLWEVDVFAGANEGLVVAELELASEEAYFERPVWLGEEVSHDARYLNTSLARRPFGTWGGAP